jgi:hypothetical protein
MERLIPGPRGPSGSWRRSTRRRRTRSCARRCPLDETAIQEAAARSKGNPLFALQLVHAWAGGGHFAFKDGRYIVPRSSLAVRAGTTAELWEERLRVLPEEF